MSNTEIAVIVVGVILLIIIIVTIIVLFRPIRTNDLSAALGRSRGGLIAGNN